MLTVVRVLCLAGRLAAGLHLRHSRADSLTEVLSASVSIRLNCDSPPSPPSSAMRNELSAAESKWESSGKRQKAHAADHASDLNGDDLNGASSL